MKTKINISNLKKIGVTFAASLIVTTGILAGPSVIKSNEVTAESRLAIMMDQEENAILYTAPSVYESFEAVSALNELEALMVEMESNVKYVAPGAEVSDAIQDLDALNTEMEASVRYIAPETDNTEFVTFEIQNLDTLATAMEAELKYAAPGADFTQSPAESQLTNETLAEKTK